MLLKYKIIYTFPIRTFDDYRSKILNSIYPGRILKKQRKKTLKINGKSIIILNMESHYIIISIAIPFIIEVTTELMAQI